MARKPLGKGTLEDALRATAAGLRYRSDVEVLVVGGAAGMLTGLLPGHRTTQDCDVIVYAPAQAWHAVEKAAEGVAKRLGLSSSWLNGDVQMFARRLPEGWESRRVLVGRYGEGESKLIVYAIGRLDLIAMKFIAGRVQDREDLAGLGVTVAEGEFVRGYLETLRGKGEHPDHIRDAVELLGSMRLKP